MLTFQVNDMTCGHCVSSITKAIKAIDKEAVVTTDLARHLVHVQPAEADPPELKAAITEAGYTPLQISTQAAAGERSPRPGGCCCGSGASRCG